MPIIEVFTDGSCFYTGTKHPIGGIGVFLCEGHEQNRGRSIRDGRITNQTMELMAALAGLHAIERLWKPGDAAVIYSDSIYVMNCMTNWILRWEVNGWVTKNKRLVQNAATLQIMSPIVKACNVTFKHIKAHELTQLAADADADALRFKHGNESADALSMQAAADGIRSGCYIKRGLCVRSNDMLGGG